MQFARDPLPLSLALIEATVNLRTYLLQAKEIEQPQQHDGGCPQCRFEPERLVICGQNNEAPYSRSRTPHAIVVAGDHAEAIVAWTEIIIKCLAPRSGFLPICVVAFKHVPKQGLLRHNEADCSVVNLKIAG